MTEQGCQLWEVWVERARWTSLLPVELRDDQVTKHEIGNRTYIVANVEPLDVDGVRTVEVGSALWLLGFLGLLPFYGTLSDDGHLWWLWTCLSGFALGMLGLEYCRRRRKARTELREAAEAGPAVDG